MTASPPIGVAGLGLVGSALAARLAGAGFAVLGWDVAAAQRDAFVQRGGACADSAADLARRCPRVVVAVFDADDVTRFVQDAPGLSLVVNCTTADPERIEALAAQLSAQGVAHVEAPLSGSSEAIREGSALAFVAGSDADCEAASDILAAIAPHRARVGTSGMGARAKLASNMVLGLNRAALAEGMAFAQALGIPRGVFLDIVRDSPAASSAAIAKGEKMVSGDFRPESRIRQHRKDVALMQAFAARARLALPLTEAHARLLDAAIADGDADLDNAALIRRWIKT